MNPFCNQGSFFSLSSLFFLSHPLHQARFLLCISGQIAGDVAIVLRMPVWHPQVTIVHIVLRAKIFFQSLQLTLSRWNHSQIWTWVGQSYQRHESEQKFHTTHSPSSLDLEWVGTFGSSMMSKSWIISTMSLRLPMSNELNWGYWVWHAVFAFEVGVNSFT